MSHDRQLDEIMNMDITPEGPDGVDFSAALFEQNFAADPNAQMYRLSEIDEATVDFKWVKGQELLLRNGNAVTIRECRGYRQGGKLIPRYVVETVEGKQGEVGEEDLIVSEAANYPSQDEAQLVADISNAMNTWYTGSVSRDYKQMVEQMDQIRMRMWEPTFGDKSPWRPERKGNKVVVKWDKDKAKALGLSK